jgi:hypothetical protein
MHARRPRLHQQIMSVAMDDERRERAIARDKEVREKL